MESEPRNSTFYIKRTIGLILLLAMSAVFLFSAWTKLKTIEPFEWTFLDLAPIGMIAAAIVARLFIGFEILIALFLLGHLFLRSFTYKATFIFLGVLTLYLLLLLIRQGNAGSCGCFGEAHPMSPAMGILKNVVMLAATIVLYYIYPVQPYKQQMLVAATVVMAALAIPFILQPIYRASDTELVHESIDLQGIYRAGKPVPSIDLRKGKQIIAFMSLTCPHCRKAAYLLQILHRQYPDMPFYMVLSGSPKNEQPFFSETKSMQVPHSIMTDIPAFTAMAGEYVPAIFWIKNSMIERKTYYTELEPGDIMQWMNKP